MTEVEKFIEILGKIADYNHPTMYGRISTINQEIHNAVKMAIEEYEERQKEMDDFLPSPAK